MSQGKGIPEVVHQFEGRLKEQRKFMIILPGEQ
jgi:hypothetical protein